MDEAARIRRLRAGFPVTAERVYLGTGSFGPLSTAFAEARRASLETELATGRYSADRFERAARARERLRAELAAVVGIEPGELALTQSTGDGLAAVLTGLRWEPGDEIVSTQHEHPALRGPLEALARRHGVRLEVAAAPASGAADTAWLAPSLTPRTKLIAFSGTAFELGQRLPIREIAALARERGVRTLLDAAQSVGAMPLDLAATGVDFCAFPLQKWLCGPEGLGGLYVRGGGPDELGRDRVIRSWDVFAAAAAHLQWLRTEAGWPWLTARCTALADHARRALGAAAGVRVLTPAAHAGLVTFGVGRNGEPAQALGPLAAALERRGFVFRRLDELGAIRISTAYFNTEDEIDALVAALAAEIS